MNLLCSLVAVLLTVYSVAGNNHLDKNSNEAQRQMARQALPMLQSLCNVFGNCNQLSSLSALAPSALNGVMAPSASAASYYSSAYPTTPAPYSAPSAYAPTTTTPAPYAAPPAPASYSAPAAPSTYMAAPAAPPAPSATYSYAVPPAPPAPSTYMAALAPPSTYMAAPAAYSAAPAAPPAPSTYSYAAPPAPSMKLLPLIALFLWLHFPTWLRLLPIQPLPQLLTRHLFLLSQLTTPLLPQRTTLLPTRLLLQHLTCRQLLLPLLLTLLLLTVPPPTLLRPTQLLLQLLTGFQVLLPLPTLFLRRCLTCLLHHRPLPQLRTTRKPRSPVRNDSRVSVSEVFSAFDVMFDNMFLKCCLL